MNQIAPRIFRTAEDFPNFSPKIGRRIMKGNVHMKTITGIIYAALAHHPSRSISLPDAEKLNVLRRLDHLRQWHSLDDKRYCVVCGKIITGQQIQVASGTRGNGALRLSCPSDGCNSIPIDWMLPTDEILASCQHFHSKEHEAATSTPINHGRMPERPHETHHRIAAQLRNFASYFNRHS
jgi:hypothetical protein